MTAIKTPVVKTENRHLNCGISYTLGNDRGDLSALFIANKADKLLALARRWIADKCFIMIIRPRDRLPGQNKLSA